jgi:hypothetical protein
MARSLFSWVLDYVISHCVVGVNPVSPGGLRSSWLLRAARYCRRWLGFFCDYGNYAATHKHHSSNLCRVLTVARNSGSNY